ncbi:terpene synthase family protein [Micromonospora sp. SL4-19]|uniref:terpene synthase family protein n=1 Tax=Micromonospora sp. SL4-19 TaxID=3399129 RepID=UPI003A4E2E08
MPMDGADQWAMAAEHGRICALAAKGQRDLQQRADSYPELFAPQEFDPALSGSIAMTMAFSAPWCDAGELQVANRLVLWIFALDWLIDYDAKTREDVDRLTAGCLAVADGATPEPGDALGGFLAEIRDELATGPAYRTHGPMWRAELRRVLDAMAREWDWKQAGSDRLPTLEEYLGNAANLASTVVNVVHWIRTGDPATLSQLDELVTVSDEVQRILRLVNDLATYERDLRWKDLNALRLVADPVEVRRRLDELVGNARALLVPLSQNCPVQADYLTRQLGFSSGFYGSTDFWGTT